MNINNPLLNNFFKGTFVVLMLSISSFIAIPAYASDEHKEDKHKEDKHAHEGEAESFVKLTSQQLIVAGISVEKIQLKEISAVINAPGEIMLNEYKTTSVTPRVSSQVVKRHAILGDSVISGQALLTLSSVDMATAQGELLVTGREWERVKKLGRKVVSASRYSEAKVNHAQAKARVLAYGMTEKQVDEFLKDDDASQANGSYQLLTPQDGTVIFDHFIAGELIEPGEKLFIISDESVLWVEAKLTPSQAAEVSIGSSVNVVADNKHFSGKVVQVHHALDKDTRTLGVRIEVANPDDQLHPGIFVETQIRSSNSELVLAVPVNAVLRSADGDWVVFVEHEKNEFEPQEIEVLKTVGDQAVIKGIEPGMSVVTHGAFFVLSELAKSGFDIHDH